jgi:PII-like signaling protein
VLLRGIEGFGLKHHLRTDRLLTLSEDLPVMAVAVDTRARIEGLLGEVDALERHGLVTLEPAQLEPGAELAGETKLTVHLGRQERIDGMPAFVAVCELLRRHGVDGATVLLGVDGTARGIRRRARFFARNADVPVMVVAVGPAERIATVLPELGDRVFTLEPVSVCKRAGRLLAPPAAEGELQELTVYASEHAELVRRLRAGGAQGVTCVRGIWGFHGDHAPHGDRLLQLRRRVPVMTIVVDTPERIASSFAIADELTARAGLVTTELLARPPL